MEYSIQSVIFKRDGIKKLDFDYVPSKLPHREDQIRELVNFFRLAIDQPGVVSRRLLITGSNGTGKTASAKKVGVILEKLAKNRDLDLIYAHVNCRTTSGKFGLVQSIIRQTAPSLPLRGYSAVELLYALWDYLNDRKKLLVLTLDEIDYYIRTTGEDIIYQLTRLTDAITDVSQRINFMFIARDHSFMNEMSLETLSRFRPQERVEFYPYLESQLKDILVDRSNEAFKKGVLPEEIICFIAGNTVKYGNGDARYAILLLLSAGLFAEREGSQEVLAEHVREAQEKTDPRISDEDITILPTNEKYVLLALSRCLKNQRAKIYVPLEEVNKVYQIICEENKAEPVGRVLLQAHLRNLKAAKIIAFNDIYEIGLNGVKAEVLEKFLKDKVNRKKLSFEA